METFPLYSGSVWIQLIFAETENWKYCIKIIFKCVNSTVGSIFNIFFWIKWLWVPWIVSKHCVNSDICLMNSKFCLLPPCNVWKKKKKKRENVLQDSAKNAESKRALNYSFNFYFYFLFLYSIVTIREVENLTWILLLNEIKSCY